MCKVILAACVLVLAASTAEARHRNWHWHGYHFGAAPYAYGFAAPEQNLQRPRSWRENVRPADMVPPNWQLQPAEPNWKGKRFLSPDGSPWFAVASFPTENEPIASHMKSIAFAEGETLTYLRGERDWIAVSGTKGDRIFYRKAIIACDGKVWHHIAFEYPMALKREMDTYVTRAAFIVNQAENDGCDKATSSTDPNP
jgi:serine/threonine-protein kinase